MTEPLWVILAAFAGGLGAALRLIVDGEISARLARRTRGAGLPWGILVVNLSGSFAIGLLSGFVAPAHPGALVLGVWLLGGYTTFSAASFDTVRLLQLGRPVAAVGNGIVQLLLAVVAAGLGLWLAMLR